MRLATFYDHVLAISEQEEISMRSALERVRALSVDLLEISSNNVKNKMREIFKGAAIAAPLKFSRTQSRLGLFCFYVNLAEASS